MNIQPVASGSVEARTTMSNAAESLKKHREQVKEEKATEQTSEPKEKQIQPEELLQNIKALTDNGLYSVRFEMFKDTDEMVINLIDTKSGDLIRQFPPEEILGMRKTLADLRGNIVETQS